MHRMTVTEPRAVQGSCGHGKDFVQCISCYEIEKQHSSLPSEKILKKWAQACSDIFFCCLSPLIYNFGILLPILECTEEIKLLWKRQSDVKRVRPHTGPTKIMLWLQWSNIVHQHCDRKKTCILLDLSKASQQGRTMQQYKFSTMLLLIE